MQYSDDVSKWSLKEQPCSSLGCGKDVPDEGDECKSSTNRPPADERQTPLFAASSLGPCLLITVWRIYPVECSDSSQCAHLGMCISGSCVCTNSYYTWPRSGPQMATKGCTKSRHSRVVAFLLQLLAGFGSGFFYLGWVGTGLGQLAVELGVFFSFTPLCCLCCGARSQRRIVRSVAWSMGLFLLFVAAHAVWQVIALVQIGGATISDGEGIPISGW
ncbi:hypothetical protein PAPYR_3875 [Paratrimastix pyriformis]|uniref:Uncharacterized protein n=1 Tax=Paratrimastix pyriformis TaxID=342808 RepID=A0ABQ8ULT2_9EUKA|nr:hypothetical protein PAPYR_3875 [Paratrimastix pyriformis]